MVTKLIKDANYEQAISLFKSSDIAGTAAASKQILDADAADTRARLDYARALSVKGHYQAASNNQGAQCFVATPAIHIKYEHADTHGTSCCCIGLSKIWNFV